jgi:DNA mismatch repair protein MutL
VTGEPVGGARVNLLPEVLSNQIAAGEVVERPVSVVKELVENALDAEAGAIFVDLADGGRALIRVVDDGVGMSRRDATLAVQRHATSKIRSAEDLTAIATLGFRGEALPSIASVSRFVLVSRAAADTVATEVRIDGGAAAEVRDASAPVGTRVEVHDLFYNVPARLKFLKRRATEMAHVGEALAALALGHPHVHFRLRHDGRTTFDHPAAPRLADRLFQVLGAKAAAHLYPVRLDGPLQVLGYLSEPTASRPNRGGLYAFINGRHVRDKVITHAVVSAYGNLLDRGRYPVGVLYLYLPPDEVDVNVHPTKAEVRFVHSGRIHQAIAQACQVMLAAAPWVGGPETRPGAARPALAPAPTASLPAPRALALIAEPTARYHGQPGGGPRWQTELRFGAAPSALLDSGSAPPPELAAGAADPATRRPDYFGRMRVIGQAGRMFIVCEDEEGLHLIDQHAAHERIGYERIKAQFAQAGVARQEMLFPLQVELTSEQAAQARAHSAVLERLGFGFEPFGGRTWQITSVPALLAKAEVVSLVRDVLAELAEIGQSQVVADRLDLLFATMACHSVIRAGDRLNVDEMRLLLTEMDATAVSGNCPHGRPVHHSLPFRDLERKMHRR